MSKTEPSIINDDWPDTQATPIETTPTIEAQPSIKSTKANTKDATTKKSAKGVVVVIVSTIILVGAGLVGFDRYRISKEQKANEIIIQKARSNIESNIASVEEKLFDVVDQQIKPLELSVKKLSEQISVLEKLILSNKDKLVSQQQLLTSLSDNEKFNTELVRVISKSSQSNTDDINGIKEVIGSLDKNIRSIKRIKTKTTSTKQSDPTKINLLKSIEGYQLFSIDIWGSEKFAIFTKGERFEKVKVDELIKGYYIEHIDAPAGEVLLSKNKNRYLVTIR